MLKIFQSLGLGIFLGANETRVYTPNTEDGGYIESISNIGENIPASASHLTVDEEFKHLGFEKYVQGHRYNKERYSNRYKHASTVTQVGMQSITVIDSSGVFSKYVGQMVKVLIVSHGDGDTNINTVFSGNYLIHDTIKYNTGNELRQKLLLKRPGLNLLRDNLE
jgi:hypothetical protein